MAHLAPDDAGHPLASTRAVSCTVRGNVMDVDSLTGRMPCSGRMVPMPTMTSSAWGYAMKFASRHNWTPKHDISYSRYATPQSCLVTTGEAPRGALAAVLHSAGEMCWRHVFADALGQRGKDVRVGLHVWELAVGVVGVRTTFGSANQVPHILPFT